ncbi:MAG TPA: hypothetical protein VD771_04545 [Gemmatimonadaceae bacterium]|nr:hypothetical protein [Gemmatimonadaceae bacterium]
MSDKTVMALVTLGVLFLLPVGGGAQINQQKFQSEARIDGIFARTGGVEAGYGFTVPEGIYVRTGLVAGIGAGRHGLEGRTDLISRFSLDPFRQSRWAPYAGAALSGRYRTQLDGGARAYLLLFLGLEGPMPFGQTAGWVPALEVGLGGGARVGVVIRRGINARR